MQVATFFNRLLRAYAWECLVSESQDWQESPGARWWDWSKSPYSYEEIQNHGMQKPEQKHPQLDFILKALARPLWHFLRAFSLSGVGIVVVLNSTHSASANGTYSPRCSRYLLAYTGNPYTSANPDAKALRHRFGWAWPRFNCGHSFPLTVAWSLEFTFF